MAGLGWQELLIVLAIVLLLFGAKKLPEVAGSMGKSIKEFRRATREADAEDERAAAESAEAEPRDTASS